MTNWNKCIYESDDDILCEELSDCDIDNYVENELDLKEEIIDEINNNQPLNIEVLNIENLEIEELSLDE